MLRSSRVVITLSVVVIAGLFLFSSTASAFSGSDWRAGNIIDDGVFYNNQSMSALDIQGFLSGQMPNCDTWGSKPSEYGGGTRAQYATSKGYAPPYTCLRDYNENGKSSAQIIKLAADTYNISPRTLLVTLQKEQRLVSDDWPWSIQYRSAMGYGCPDTAACDTQYYGLTNQVMNAARQFRLYANSPNSYRYKPFQNNTVYFNPNLSCGSTNLYIENFATAGLYNYTPYQPNQSSLNNLYGSGDGCGAYGNRNFWRYFNDWFRTTRSYFGTTASSSSPYSKSPCNISYFDTTSVGRLYNPDTADFLYTTSITEACLAKSYGYIWDGVVMRSAMNSETDSIPVYRIANSERHLFTTSSGVRNDYIQNYGYHDEGVGFYVYSTSSSDRLPLNGLQKGPTFMLSSAGKEVESYVNSYGYFSFGTIAYTKKMSGSQAPVYRLTRSNIRLYTSSPMERLSALSAYGFTDEGAVSQNDSIPNESNYPLYRLRSPSGVYFYTSNRVERDAAVINYGYYSEGIGFYSLMYSYKPVYRAVNPRNAFRIFTDNDVEYRASSSLYGYSLEGVGWYSN